MNDIGTMNRVERKRALTRTLSPSEGEREKRREWGGGWKCSRASSSCDLPIGNRRYSRLKTCATGVGTRERFMGRLVEGGKP